MEISIIGTESLGVRGLSCVVKTPGRRFLIDPGVALGYLRHGHLPHPCQVAVGDAVRKRILSEFSKATDIIISHYHGDHIPLLDANPYQIPLGQVPPLDGISLWCKGTAEISSHSLKRRQDIIEETGRELPEVEGMYDISDTCNTYAQSYHQSLNPTQNATQASKETSSQTPSQNSKENLSLSFSRPVPHGTAKSHLGSVMMTRISDGDEVFVHASDIQMLNSEAIEIIMAWQPDIVIASGPPLYLNRISAKKRTSAWKNALTLANSVQTLILDHHLLRSHEGCQWIEELSAEAEGTVLSGAAFMGKEPLLLEAGRNELYEKIPVPERWHERYANGEVGFENFVDSVSILRKEIHSVRWPESGN
ncbi:MAG: hypothetical protein U9N40_00550 [Euryarchaeota archaeon]|nr:hypothetical protein [Euryarchaeota archaeon]